MKEHGQGNGCFHRNSFELRSSDPIEAMSLVRVHLGNDGEDRLNDRIILLDGKFMERKGFSGANSLLGVVEFRKIIPNLKEPSKKMFDRLICLLWWGEACSSTS